jgi:thioredoxin-like negative regulator of GroEL
VVELAVALAKLGRGPELVDATGATPSTRWLEAALAYASGDLSNAAEICAAIGALPEEAYARLAAADVALAEGRRDDAERELTSALDFYRRVGASAFHRDAKALLMGS